MVVGIPGMKVLFSSVPHLLFLFFFLSLPLRNILYIKCCPIDDVTNGSGQKSGILKLLCINQYNGYKRYFKFFQCLAMVQNIYTN